MKVHTIEVKGYPVYVVKMQVAGLDPKKCSDKFNSYNLSTEKVVLVECEPTSGIPILYNNRLFIYSLNELGQLYSYESL